MKLHIHDPNIRHENYHQNISCLPTITLNARIGAVCCPNEAIQVYLNHAISHWDKETLVKTTVSSTAYSVENIKNISDLLEKGGILTIRDTDLLLVANSIMREPTNRDGCVSLITKSKWVYDMSFVKEFLKMLGFNITNSYYVLEDYSFTIIGEKN